MNKFNIADFFLYKWRFLLGYLLIASGLIVVLILAGIYLPGGISNQEMQSVVKSSSLTFETLASAEITNLPYHLLQHACMTIFGVTIFSIKLPSLILAFLSAIGIILILRRWFKPSVGVLASLVAITTGQFLFIAQDGTPNILYVFWPVCLLLLATLISYQKRLKLLYVLGFCIAAALSMFTPLSIYLIIAFVIVIILHPHLRFLIKQVPQVPLIIGMVFTFIIVSPLVVSIVNDPGLGLNLLGFTSHLPNLSANIASLGAEFFGFAKPGGLTVMTPYFELGSMLLIGIGTYHVARTRVTARNYVIISWVVCLIPLMIINPNLTGITFLPLVLLLATGLNTLLSYWYRLFPSNPYARVGGLIPIVILVSVLVFSGANRFMYGYQYDPSIVTNFSNDLKIIPSDTKQLVVANSEKDFYDIVSLHNKTYSVSTEPTGDSFLATRKSHNNFSGYKIDQIITSSLSNDSDRFYLYTKIAN